MFGSLKRFSVTAVASLALLSPIFTSASPPDALLTGAESHNGIIQLDTPTYNQLVNAGGEKYRSDHSLVVLLTANRTPGLDCGPCRSFQPGWEEVAKAWKKKAKGWKQGKAGHYFAEVEFVNGREIFQQLELSYAPVIIFIPAGAPSSQGVRYAFERTGFTPEAFSDWLSNLMGTPTGYRKPFPWASVLTFSAAALITTGAALFAVAKLSAVMEAQGSGGSASLFKALGGFAIQGLSLGLIVICCAGYMWNIIRGSPFVNMKGDGKIEYFSRQFQHQLAVETLIVAGIYSILAFSVVALILFVPKQRDPTKQRAGVYVWSVILLAGISVLFAVFRIKNPSYPFRLFL